MTDTLNLETQAVADAIEPWMCGTAKVYRQQNAYVAAQRAIEVMEASRCEIPVINYDALKFACAVAKGDNADVREIIEAYLGALPKREICPLWQPIETAPKHKNLLLYALTDTETGNWKMGTGHYGDNGIWTWDGTYLDKSYHQKPTHWMKLPAPPAYIESSQS